MNTTLQLEDGVPDDEAVQTEPEVSDQFLRGYNEVNLLKFTGGCVLSIVLDVYERHSACTGSVSFKWACCN